MTWVLTFESVTSESGHGLLANSGGPRNEFGSLPKNDPKQVLVQLSPLNKYYFDTNFIIAKHDSNHDKRRILHTLISKIRWFWTPKRVTRDTRRLPKTHPFLRGFLVAHVYALIPDCPPTPTGVRWVYIWYFDWTGAPMPGFVYR